MFDAKVTQIETFDFIKQRRGEIHQQRTAIQQQLENARLANPNVDPSELPGGSRAALFQLNLDTTVEIAASFDAKVPQFGPDGSTPGTAADINLFTFIHAQALGGEIFGTGGQTFQLPTGGVIYSGFWPAYAPRVIVALTGLPTSPGRDVTMLCRMDIHHYAANYWNKRPYGTTLPPPGPEIEEAARGFLVRTNHLIQDQSRLDIALDIRRVELRGPLSLATPVAGALPTVQVNKSIELYAHVIVEESSAYGFFDNPLFDDSKPETPSDTLQTPPAQRFDPTNPDPTRNPRRYYDPDADGVVTSGSRRFSWIATGGTTTKSPRDRAGDQQWRIYNAPETQAGRYSLTLNVSHSGATGTVSKPIVVVEAFTLELAFVDTTGNDFDSIEIGSDPRMLFVKYTSNLEDPVAIKASVDNGTVALLSTTLVNNVKTFTEVADGTEFDRSPSSEQGAFDTRPDGSIGYWIRYTPPGAKGTATITTSGTIMLTGRTPLTGEATATLEIVPKDAPQPPSSVTLELTATRALKATWTRGDNAPTTIVQLWRRNDDGTTTRLAQRRDTDLTHTFTSRGAGTFFVRCYGEAADGTDSATFRDSADLVVTANVPETPSAVTLARRSTTGWRLSWTAPNDGGSPITRYEGELYRGATAGTGSELATFSTINGSIRSTLFTGYQGTGRYSGRVRAVNAVGAGPNGISNLVTVQAALRPGIPTVTLTRDGTTGWTVSWTAPSDGGATITAYRVELYRGSTRLDDDSTTGSARSTSFTGYQGVGRYSARVRATNSAGNGSYGVSSTVSILPNTAPGNPRNASLSRRGTTGWDLSWSAPSSDGGSPITRYEGELYRGATAGTGNELATFSTVDGSTTSARITGFQGVGRYSFRVRAVNDIGSSGNTASNLVSILS